MMADSPSIPGLQDLIRQAVRDSINSITAVVDQEARGMAKQALQSFNSHERQCAERASIARDDRARMERKIDDLAEKLDQKIVELLTRITERADGARDDVDAKIARIYLFYWSATSAFIILLLTIIGFLISPTFKH